MEGGEAMKLLIIILTFLLNGDQIRTYLSTQRTITTQNYSQQFNDTTKILIQQTVGGKNLYVRVPQEPPYRWELGASIKEIRDRFGMTSIFYKGENVLYGICLVEFVYNQEMEFVQIIIMSDSVVMSYILQPAKEIAWIAENIA